MGYDTTDILFASLVGAKVNVPRFNAVQNELMKHVLPPIPFLPLKNKTSIDEVDGGFNVSLWKADAPTPEEQQFFPLTFESEKGQKYLLPYEPMISISSSNTIVKRNVAKQDKLEGTIKERWSRGDYEITITGVLIGDFLIGSIDKCFPRKDFIALKKILTSTKRWRVYCEPLQLLDIHYIVIEDFSFPFTKGENVQAYEIKAVSDFSHKLLLDITD